MDFEKFEKNNWFQLIINRILRISDGNVVKQDLISGLLILTIFANIGGAIKFIYDNIQLFNINNLITSILELIKNAEQIFNYFSGEEIYNTINQTNEFLEPNFFSLMNYFIRILIRLVIAVIPFYIGFRLIRLEKFSSQIIGNILMILFPVILYGEYQFTISIGLLIIAITFIQFGKGNIYRFLCILMLYLRQFMNSQIDVPSDSRKLTIKVVVQIFSYVIISVIISFLFKLSLPLCLLLVMVLIMRFGLQLQTKNPHIVILIKAIIYIIVFIVVLLSSEQIKDFLSIFTVLFAIYFAVDRFFSLYDEIQTLVKKDEINYYLYFDNSMDILEQKFLPDEFLFATIAEIDEIKLFGQLILRTELGIKNSFEKLLHLIEEKRAREYESYRLLTLSLEYKMQKTENEKLTIIDFINNNLEHKIYYNSQKVLPIEFLVLYGEELRLKKEYELSLEYLEFSKYYSSNQYIDSYYKCKQNLDNEKN